MTITFATAAIALRAVIGLIVATGIAVVARRAGSLSTSGALAAILTGTVSTAAGGQWGALLVAYFVAATLLSRLGRQRKEALTSTVVAKGGPRDATQVIANGGVYAACLAVAAFAADRTSILLDVAALGALAASSADTWATELGTLYGAAPRSLRNFKPLPPGTSGAVSAIGCIAMCAGAFFIAMGARLLGLAHTAAVVAVAGVAGALADSLLGATLQERRWCATCAIATERRVHDCGAETSLRGGFRWMDNDVVNLVATVVGAAVAALLTSV